MACRQDSRWWRAGSSSSTSISSGSRGSSGVRSRAATQVAASSPSVVPGGSEVSAAVRSAAVTRPLRQACCRRSRDGNTGMPASTAIRAATVRTLWPMRDQCGLTAIARSSGQAGAIAAQAVEQAASIRRCSRSSRGASIGATRSRGGCVRTASGAEVCIIISRRSNQGCAGARSASPVRPAATGGIQRVGHSVSVRRV